MAEAALHVVDAIPPPAAQATRARSSSQSSDPPAVGDRGDRERPGGAQSAEATLDVFRAFSMNAEQLWSMGMEAPRTFIRRTRASIASWQIPDGKPGETRPTTSGDSPSRPAQETDLRAALRNRGGAPAPPRLSVSQLDAPALIADRDRHRHRRSTLPSATEKAPQPLEEDLRSASTQSNMKKVWNRRLLQWVRSNDIPEAHLRILGVSLTSQPQRWHLRLLLQGVEICLEEASDQPTPLARVSQAEKVASGAPVETFLQHFFFLQSDGPDSPAGSGTPEQTPLPSDRQSDGREESFSEANTAAELEDGEHQAMQQGSSFAGWLAETSPFVRMDGSAETLSWDFPLSKDEKRERLVMFLCRENDNQWQQL
eukprot:CAMPEP_0178461148 /NCGR_PEP_ID=MMETSP0689_2-20121128/49136_1 /TAXON_ID=160604 /ORGANISM="Amphidinium massartii, Strain CS-259" /LENGTH=369 /DNA_ID=CAMNT_0020087927 /DNA_START=76 /DNA_END=1182 /DNA_ORIENTATION=+